MFFRQMPLAIRNVCPIILILSSMTVSSTRSLVAAEATYPISVAVAAEGTVYIADLKLPGIWKWKDGTAEIYFQGSKKYGTPLNGVRCVTMDKAGKLLAGDSSTREVYRFDEAGSPKPLTNGGIGMPQGIAVGEDGTLYVSDLETHTIYKVPASGGEATVFARVQGPLGLVMDGEKTLVVVTRQGQLFKVSPDGKVASWGEGKYKFAQGIAVGGDRRIFVSDSYSKSLFQVDPEGKSSVLLSGDPLRGPVGLALNGEKLLVADPKVPGIFSVSGDGKSELIFPIESGK